MNNIVSLNSMDEDDEEFMGLLESLKDQNKNAICLVEKEDGTMTVACSFKDRRDIVYALYRLQRLAEMIVSEEE